MRTTSSSGFTLLELLVAVVVLAIALGFGIPAFSSSLRTHSLHDAVDGMAGQIRLARQLAIASSADRPMHFREDSLGTDYHVHNPDGSITGWQLPAGVHFDPAAGVPPGFVFHPSGRASQSGTLVLVNDLGQTDSLTVQLSGFVLAH